MRNIIDFDLRSPHIGVTEIVHNGEVVATFTDEVAIEIFVAGVRAAGHALFDVNSATYVVRAGEPA